MKSQALLWAVGAVMILGLGCSAERPYPFDPATMQRNNREAAKELPARALRPIPTELDPTFRPRRANEPTTAPVEPFTGVPIDQDPQFPMTLQEVIHRTVNNSMDVRVASYEPGINNYRVIEAESRFDPTVFLSPFYERREPAADVTNLTLNRPPQLELWGVSAGIRQELETGGTAEIRHETNSYDSDRTTRFYNNNLVAELKQPLLRNFGTDVNRARIVVARNDQRISLLEYRRKLEETLFDTERTYWELTLAINETKIAEELLRNSIDSANILVERATEDVTRVQTSQANSAVQQRRTSVISARSHVRDLSDQLKRYMNDPELPVASNVLIVPATPPLATAIHFDPQEQVNQALEHRLELAQQLLRIESGSTVVRVAKSNMLPELSLTQTVTVNGADTEYSRANEGIFDGDATSYRAGLQFEIPIGNRQARAIYQRTVLQRQQAIDQYRATVEQVALDVKNAVRNVQTTWEQMAANRQAVLATADTLDAVTTRMREGAEARTPSFVQLQLDTQARLADAQRSEAQAIANYSVAITTLERAKGTLLRYDNVLMEEDRLMPVTRGRMLAKVPPYVAPATTQPAESVPPTQPVQAVQPIP